MKKILFFLAMFAVVLSHAQEQHIHSHKNEVSTAIGLVPLPAENELAAGLHLHYIRGIGHKNRWGAGIGFESIFDDHKHYTTSAVFQFRIIQPWVVALAPGLMFRREMGEFETQFSTHIETAYEFEIGHLHIGPVLELGIEQLGIHYMLGLHLGVGF